MSWIIIALIMLFMADRAISYYGATLGLIYYLGLRHDDLISDGKVKELRNYALARKIRELLKID